jgi:sugar lactone lactonase YvrE
MGAIVLLAAAVVSLLVLADSARDSTGADGPIRLVATFPAPSEPRLANPMGIASDGALIYVAESDAGVVRVFTLDGASLGAIVVPPAPGAADAYPSALAMAGPDLAVVDGVGRRVVVLRSSLEESATVVRVIGQADPKTAPIQPTAMTFGGDEYFVGDGGDHLVKVYDRNGLYLRTLGQYTEPSLTFVGGLLLADGQLFVSDSNTGRVLVFDPLTGGRRALFPDAYAMPRGLSSAGDGLVAVADTFERVVWICSAEGARVDSIDDGAGVALRSPRDVLYLPEERRLLVTDSQAGIVAVYTLELR